MRVLLVGNYLPDRQYSMQQGLGILARGLEQMNIDVTVLRPKARFGSFFKFLPGLNKWLAYIDKYVLFVLELLNIRRRAHEYDIVHIVDQANAVYLPFLGKLPNVVTCNDLIAIRSALGETPEYLTGFLGYLLQHWILRSLKQAQHIVCISEATRSDCLRLCNRTVANTSVVHYGMEYAYRPMDKEEARMLLRSEGIFHQDYWLHVGSHAWYKNRLGVLVLYVATVKDAQMPIIFVGPRLNAREAEFVRAHRLQRQVHIVESLDAAIINALYTRAKCLVFPSYYEGFGLPIVEALASGCPVVTLDSEPMRTVGGDTPLYLTRPKSDAIEHLTQWAIEASPTLRVFLDIPANERLKKIQAGLQHAQHFSAVKMIQGYIELYQQLTQKMDG